MHWQGKREAADLLNGRRAQLAFLAAMGQRLCLFGDPGMVGFLEV